jgi:adenylosuccinate lyase
MAENLKLQRDFLFSEALMIELGKVMGKQTAHHVVYEAAMEAHERGCPIVDRLIENPEVKARFDRKALEAITDPSRHLGEALTMTDQAVELSRRELDEL